MVVLSFQPALPQPPSGQPVQPSAGATSSGGNSNYSHHGSLHRQVSGDNANNVLAAAASQASANVAAAAAAKAKVQLRLIAFEFGGPAHLSTGPFVKKSYSGRH